MSNEPTPADHLQTLRDLLLAVTVAAGGNVILTRKEYEDALRYRLEIVPTADERVFVRAWPPKERE